VAGTWSTRNAPESPAPHLDQMAVSRAMRAAIPGEFENEDHRRHDIGRRAMCISRLRKVGAAVKPRPDENRGAALRGDAKPGTKPLLVGGGEREAWHAAWFDDPD